MRIAVDLMGGDVGPEVVLPAVLRAVGESPELSLDLVGDQALIDELLAGQGASGNSRLLVSNASEVVTMEDRPSVALRHKRDSSMYIAVDKVRAGEAEACVSCGNTGALMGISRHLLKTLPGIDRPAIIKAIPSLHGRCYVLDLGANINCDAENLIQFAAMGSLLCGALEGVERPRVGLLNVGEEDTKGGAEIHLAASLLKENRLINFVGFVEGSAIYQSDADVIVCDGWVGNVALKTSEGLAKFVAHLIDAAFARNLASKAAGVLAGPVLQQLRDKLTPEEYNGASMLGLQGIVVKSHGNTTARGFYQAIQAAVQEVEQDIPTLINDRLDEMLNAYH